MYVRKNVHLGFKKKLSKMFQKYSKLCLPGQYGKVRRAGQYMSKDAKQKPCTPPHCRLLPQKGLTGDSDLRLHHMPEDLELLNHK
jgi:hypothetical protein